MNADKDPIESDWHITPLKTKIERNTDKKKTLVRTKENRNFCEKWLNLFSPWLTRCEDDYNRPFCRACQRPLDNNRFRLQRHERTAKHARNQEILLNDGEDAVRLILSRNKQKSRYIKKNTVVKSFTTNIERANCVGESTLKKIKIPKASTPTYTNKDDSFVYTKQESKDNDYYYSSPRYSRPPLLPQPSKKDSFDLFFEAISATVKNLPPKLAAEVKSRISQVIAEFELRAICEKEAKEKAQQSVIELPAQVDSVVTIDPVITTNFNGNTSTENPQTIECTRTVTQYLYPYQQKKESN